MVPQGGIRELPADKHSKAQPARESAARGKEQDTEQPMPLLGDGRIMSASGAMAPHVAAPDAFRETRLALLPLQGHKAPMARVLGYDLDCRLRKCYQVIRDQYIDNELYIERKMRRTDSKRVPLELLLDLPEVDHRSRLRDVNAAVTSLKKHFEEIMPGVVSPDGLVDAPEFLLNLPVDTSFSPLLEISKVGDNDPREMLRGGLAIRVKPQCDGGRPIPPFTFLGFYTGTFRFKHEYLNLQHQMSARQIVEMDSYAADFLVPVKVAARFGWTQAFEFAPPEQDFELTVSGGEGGNELRLLNDPTIDPFSVQDFGKHTICGGANCNLFLVTIGPLVFCGMFTIKEIQPEEECTYAYGLGYWMDLKKSMNLVEREDKHEAHLEQLKRQLAAYQSTAVVSKPAARFPFEAGGALELSAAAAAAEVVRERQSFMKSGSQPPPDPASGSLPAVGELLVGPTGATITVLKSGPDMKTAANGGARLAVQLADGFDHRLGDSGERPAPSAWPKEVREPVGRVAQLPRPQPLLPSPQQQSNSKESGKRRAAGKKQQLVRDKGFVLQEKKWQQLAKDDWTDESSSSEQSGSFSGEYWSARPANQRNRSIQPGLRPPAKQGIGMRWSSQVPGIREPPRERSMLELHQEVLALSLPAGQTPRPPCNGAQRSLPPQLQPPPPPLQQRFHPQSQPAIGIDEGGSPHQAPLPSPTTTPDAHTPPAPLLLSETGALGTPGYSSGVKRSRKFSSRGRSKKVSRIPASLAHPPCIDAVGSIGGEHDTRRQLRFSAEDKAVAEAGGGGNGGEHAGQQQQEDEGKRESVIKLEVGRPSALKVSDNKSLLEVRDMGHCAIHPQPVAWAAPAQQQSEPKRKSSKQRQPSLPNNEPQSASFPPDRDHFMAPQSAPLKKEPAAVLQKSTKKSPSKEARKDSPLNLHAKQFTQKSMLDSLSPAKKPLDVCVQPQQQQAQQGGMTTTAAVTQPDKGCMAIDLSVAGDMAIGSSALPSPSTFAAGSHRSPLGQGWCEVAKGSHFASVEVRRTAMKVPLLTGETGVAVVAEKEEGDNIDAVAVEGTRREEGTAAASGEEIGGQEGARGREKALGKRARTQDNGLYTSIVVLNPSAQHQPAQQQLHRQRQQLPVKSPSTSLAPSQTSGLPLTRRGTAHIGGRPPIQRPISLQRQPVRGKAASEERTRLHQSRTLSPRLLSRAASGMIVSPREREGEDLHQQQAVARTPIGVAAMASASVPAQVEVPPPPVKWTGGGNAEVIDLTGDDYLDYAPAQPDTSEIVDLTKFD